MTKFSDYKDSYPHVRLEREDGILQITLHTDGGELLWGFEPHHELAEAMSVIGLDEETKVIILTHAGDAWIRRGSVQAASGDSTVTAKAWATGHTMDKRLHTAFLDIEAPVISALHGPAVRHAELPLLADIVLASPQMILGDLGHYPRGIVPGDGIHVVFPMLLGLNRARYLMLTGGHLTAQELLDMGVVAEIHEHADLVPRAWELARKLAAGPDLATRFFRPALLQDMKQRMLSGLSHGLMLEGLAALDHWAPDEVNSIQPIPPEAL